MNRKATYLFGVVALVALMLSAAFATGAGASPAWKFNGEELKTTETILGGAVESSMTIPGMTTTCEDFLYELSISNSGGTGKGSLTDLPLFNCTTNAEACAVESITAEKLPWSSHLATFSSSPYIVFEGVKVGIYYEGEECVLSEILVSVTGTAGGKIDNTTQSATFNNSTLAASGTSLKALGQKIEWNGVFPTEAFQVHREQAISAS